MRTASKPTGFGLVSPAPQTEVMLMSASSSSSSERMVMSRATALAWMPTARHEPSAASDASDGLGAVSWPRSPGGASTTWAGRVRMKFGDGSAFQRPDRAGIRLALGDQILEALLVDRRKDGGGGGCGFSTHVLLLR